MKLKRKENEKKIEFSDFVLLCFFFFSSVKVQHKLVFKEGRKIAFQTFLLAICVHVQSSERKKEFGEEKFKFPILLCSHKEITNEIGISGL